MGMGMHGKNKKKEKRKEKGMKSWHACQLPGWKAANKAI